MGRYFALTLEVPQSQVRLPKAERKGQTKTKPNKLGMLIVIFLTLFGLMYLFQVNSLATTNYDIKKLERQLLDLKETNKRFELEAAHLKSIQSVEETVKTLNLVPSGSVRYVQDSGYALK